VPSVTVGELVTLTSGLRLSCVDYGDASDPAVVALAGPTDSWRSYRLVLEQLLPGVRVVAVSQRGHGDSDKPATGYRVEDFAADVVPLMNALGIGRAVVAGHSGSSLVARRVALDHPERVAGLVLEASPTTLSGRPDLQEFMASTVARLRDPVDRDVARSFIVDTSSRDMAPDFVDELVDEVRKVPARVWREVFAGLLAYDDLPAVGTIGVPTLLVWGDQDRLVSRQMQDELRSRIPGARLVVHAGAGHTPRWDDPSRFATDLAGFVRDLPWDQESG